MSVFVAVPNMGGVVPELVTKLLYWVKNPEVEIITLPEGWQPLSVARNRVVQMFLDSKCSHLWWVDCDVVPPIDALDRLFAADKDAVSATCFCMGTHNGDYFPYPTVYVKEGDFYRVTYGEGLVEVDAVGGGCVLVHRRVYETLGEEPYEYVSLNQGTKVLTCDFNIWQKAKKLGFKLFVDFGILCDHQRKCSIKGVQDYIAGLVDNG